MTLLSLNEVSKLPGDCPFSLHDDAAYRRWRQEKLANRPRKAGELLVEFRDPACLTTSERDAVAKRIANCGMAIYSTVRGKITDRDCIKQIAAQFGLVRLDANLCAEEDAISAITVNSTEPRGQYIPYTNRSIAMHTDGYYNTLDKQILSMLLHCVNPAAEGGMNELLDHELLYIQLRDIEPKYVQALAHPQAMTLPANEVGGEMIRPARCGPVFMLRPDGRLHMRYTDRSRSIIWRQDESTHAAVKALKQLLHKPSAWCFRHKLSAGQGLICNNILHSRSAFIDGDKPRLLYRARFCEAITVAG